MGTEVMGSRRTKKIAEEAGRQAARDTYLEMNFGPEDDSGEAASVDSSTAAVGERRDPGFDIFENVGHPLSQQGVTVRYTIKKNNELAGVKKHPYSWLDLARDFGHGDFQVIAKDPNKKYLSSQNQTISEDADVFNHMDDEESEETAKTASQTQIPWQQPQMGFMEMFNLIQTQSDRARSESLTQATQQAQTQVAMITAMTEMMKNQQLQGQTLFMEMTKMTAQVADKMSQTQEKLMEKLNSRMDKLAELAVKKPEGPSWGEIMKMQSDSQNKGFELFSKITDLAERKADEKVEMIESMKESSPDAPAKKSMTDTLIESLLPVITASMLQNQQASQLALAQAAQKKNQLPQPRRSVPRPGGVNPTSPSNGGVQRRPGTSEVRNAATSKEKEKTVTKPSSTVVANSGANFGESILVSRTNTPPIVDSNMVEQSPVIEVMAQKVVKNDSRLADRFTVVDTTQDMDIKAKCKETLPLFLGTMMLDNVTSDVGAVRTLEHLNDQGISREMFLNHVTLEDLTSEAVQFDLPKEAHTWLNELYAHIQDQPRNDARRELDPGSTHAAT